DYLAIYDPLTEALDPKTLPRTRTIPPPRILSISVEKFPGNSVQKFPLGQALALL
ncbi:MAG: hypothetical protein QOC86_2699, partial [Gaiellales bacterium]|nr:hypothetical protein [Gaiellales bacterium]